MPPTSKAAKLALKHELAKKSETKPSWVKDFPWLKKTDLTYSCSWFH